MFSVQKIGLFFAGFLAAWVVLLAGGFLYLNWGHLPVAAADAAFPMEALIVHVPLGARIHREMETPPFAGDEQVYRAGAAVYKENCSQCHGLPGHDVSYAKWMYPQSPQLFDKHPHGNVVGVSDDEPGETFWKVKNGIRLTGMPAFQHTLSTEQMWDATLLLKVADQPLSAAVLAELK